MKRGFLIYCILISQLALAQPVTKIYGYSQSFTPGIVPQRDIAENPGTAIRRSHTIINYYIYIKISGSVSVQPQQIWIKNRWYKIVRSPQVKTPVYADQPEKKLLVPLTGYKVLQLQLGDTLSTGQKLSVTQKKMMKNSELVFAYKWKGVIYYSQLKKITVLDRVQGI